VIKDEFSLKKQKIYIKFAKNKDILELGGGAGDFVSLCKPFAKSILSIDNKPASPDVKKFDIINFLKQNKRKFDLIYARHVIEHFEPEDIIFIFNKSYQFLRPDGILIIIFPNIRNIHVATYDF